MPRYAPSIRLVSRYRFVNFDRLGELFPVFHGHFGLPIEVQDGV